MKSKGQAASEYPMVLALVGLIAVAALVYLGVQIANGQFDNANKVASADGLYGLLDGKGGNGSVNTGGQGATPQTRSGDDAAAGQTTITLSNTVGTGSTGSMEITTASGITLTLPNDINAIDTNVETAGGNGTTRMVLANLEAVIQQLEESGEITPEQAGQLNNLANKGHQIANSQASVEAAVLRAQETNTKLFFAMDGPKNKKDGVEFNELSVTPDGMAAIQNGRPCGSGCGTLMSQFDQAYHQAVADGSLDDPGVKSLIDALTTRIVASGKSTNDAFAELQQSSVTPETFSQTTGRSMRTHIDSSTICNTGGGTDSGVQCQ